MRKVLEWKNPGLIADVNPTGSCTEDREAGFKRLQGGHNKVGRAIVVLTMWS